MNESYSNLLSNSSSFPTPFIALVIFAAAVMLYHSIFINIFKKIIEEVFFAAQDFSQIHKTYLYICLINFPFLILILASVFYNNSILGLQIALTVDQMYIFLVTGYICWIQQSRHTPIRGILLIRDFIFVTISVGLLFDVYYSGNLGFDTTSPLLAIFFIYHIVFSYFQTIQDLILRGFGLKQSSNYNSKFLLTSKHVIPDFLQIRDIISEQRKEIEQQLQDFNQISSSLQSNQQDQQILMNFAKLFLPIKKATQLKNKNDNAIILKQISEQWDQISQQSDSQSDQEEQLQKNVSRNDSGDQIAFNKDTYTYNQDFVIQRQNTQSEMGKYQTALKYLFYPIYIAKKGQGRLKYFVNMFATAAVVFSMYIISNSANYLDSQIKSTSLISIVVGLCLIYPSTNYFVQISAKNDYDFTNIFVLSIVLKVMLFGVGTLLYSLFFTQTINYRVGSVSVLLARIITLAIYLIFMILKRFATRNSNLKFFVGLFACSCVARLISQIIINSQNSK